MRYVFGDYTLDTQRYELHRAGELLKLRPKVFQVLAYLLVHHDRVVPKTELLEHVWPNQFIGDATLNSCIMGVRKALGDDGRTPRCLHTVHGQGYRVVAPVQEWEHLPTDEVPLPAPRPVDALPVLDPEPLPAGEDALRAAYAPLGSAPVGEHKQVTVLCGAVAGAPALAARLGAEAMHRVMQAFFMQLQAVLARYDGTLMHVTGDGFTALFGAPVAQEDHTRRAVLAALELRQRLHAPDGLDGQPHGIALCLGLHTGSVVVGPLSHESQQPYTAAGDTLHVATRLQHQAAPDTILVSAAAYALVQAEVQGEVYETHGLETSSTPVPVYDVHGFMRRWAGIPRRGARPLSRFVGRTQALAVLHERLEQAVGGQGQVIGIVGELGMGKSRLLAELVHRLRGQPVLYCEGHCLAYGSATPYLPVRDLLRQLWDLPDTAAPDTLTATIQQRLRAAGVESEPEVLMLLQLLDVPVDLGPLAALSPPERRARTFALLRQFFLHASQRQPLVLAVENLHWIDPTTAEWLAALAAQVGGTAILLLATYRPGYQLSWLAHSWATQVALPPLTPPDSLAVVQAVPQAARLSARQHQAIVAQAAG